jgi:hypothetical protein
VVPSRPSSANGPAVWTCAAAGCRIFALDRQASPPHLHHDPRGDRSSRYAGGRSLLPPDPPPGRPPAARRSAVVTADEERPLGVEGPWRSAGSGCWGRPRVTGAVSPRSFRAGRVAVRPAWCPAAGGRRQGRGGRPGVAVPRRAAGPGRRRPRPQAPGAAAPPAHGAGLPLRQPAPSALGRLLVAELASISHRAHLLLLLLLPVAWPGRGWVGGRCRRWPGGRVPPAAAHRHGSG